MKAKRSLSLLLAVILCLSSFMGISVTAFAAEKKDVYLIDLPRGNEPDKDGWGHPALSLMNGWSTFDTDYVTVKAIGDYEGDSCYCIEPGVSLYTGDSLSKEAEDFWDNYPSKYNKTIVPDDIKKFIGRIMQYGYTGKNSTDWISTNPAGAEDCANHLATQLLIWETVIGERDKDFNKIDAHDYGKKNIKEIIQGNHPLKSRIFDHYDRIEASVKSHIKVPSFTERSQSKAKTVELKWNGKNYSAELADKNNVLGNYEFSANGFTFEKSGSVLTVTADKAPKKEVLVTADKKNGSRKGVITWTDEKIGPQTGQLQDIVTYGADVSDPVKAYFNVKVSTGNCEILKTSEDGKVDGIRFSLKGNGTEAEFVTDSNGRIFIDNLPSGVYTVTEYPIDKYVAPKSQTVTIVEGQTATINFSNVLKKFRVSVVKSDIEKGDAQGDAKLSGAKYGLYKGDALIATYETDNNASFTTDYFPCDTDWTIRELEASEGYLVNGEIYAVGADPKLYTVEMNSVNLDVTEQIKKGKIAVIKHCDDGETQIETPEEGAEFEVFLKSAGNYVDAEEAERDILVCDEYGFAESKSLPYGIYTVKQIKGWAGKELLPAFDVFVKEDGEVYRYLINNAAFESLIEIVKKDAETGKVIPAAGVGFKVRNTDTGEFVVQHINYPTPVDIDTYYTGTTGQLMMPEPLGFGNYELIEQCSAYGYVLDPTPVPFKVDGTQAAIVVEKHNVAQKGTITVGKTGEVFSSVAETGGLYQPVYDSARLGGAVYEVYADEDIVTLDGTVREKKDELVATIETGSDGFGTSIPLYLGKYRIVEKTAPYSMVLNSKPKFVELTYAGENVEVTSAEVLFCNERQRAEISLSKILEQNELFGIGGNGEILSVQFGLFAAEDLVAADGSVIPKDGLLEIANCAENGRAVFKTDVPVGAKLYVKEITAEEHYLISNEKYPVEFVYAGQDNAVVEIKANGGEAIKNDLIYGNIRGFKIDRETEESVAGALFGLFRPDETEFTEETALLTAESQPDGIFTFEQIPYGNWLIKELRPAESFLPNEEIYPVTVSGHEQIIEITVVNDRIPEIGTTAAVDGEKEICATEVFTLTDTVFYKHLIPGKEYVLKGVLMDKSTGRPLVIDGEEIHSETVFTPETPAGKAVVEFVFDSKYIKEDTDIVVFESLYQDGKELAVHADIEDEGQTIKVKIPEIRTQATADGKKEITANGRVKIEDAVSYKNLTPGKEYTVKGVLMDKSTGKPLLVDGEEIRSSFTFKPDVPDGEITVAFVFDASGLTAATEIVVFESLYCDDAEIAAHADIKDEGQTVKITPPVPDIPQTGDESNLGFWIGLGAAALGGLVSSVVIYFKKKKGLGEGGK